MAVRGESDWSTTLVGSSPMTTSTWGGASATPIDKESVVDEEEDEEEEEEEEEEEDCPRGRGATERRGRVTRRRGRRPRYGRHNYPYKKEGTRLNQTRRARYHSVLRAMDEKMLGYQKTHKEKAQGLGTVGTTICRAQGPRNLKRWINLNR